MPRRFTRQEFYDLVWSKPITHIAKDFGLSDVAIHKICKKNGVPNPPLGYWAKKASGKPVTQTALPPPEKGMTDAIVIAEGRTLSEPDSLRAAREQARINASSAVEEEPAAPHPVLERTITALEKARPDERGLVRSTKAGCANVAVSHASIARLSLALDRLLAAAAVQGFQVVKSEKGAVFSGHDVQIAFSIHETVKRVKHELTAAELAEEERHKKTLRPNDWFSADYFRRRFPEWDYIPTGQLAVELEDIYFSGAAPRRNFRDGKTQKVEAMSEDIAVGLAVFAAAKKEKARRDKEWAEQLEIERRQRQEAARRQHIAKRRYEEMTDVLADVEKAARLQQLVKNLKTEMPSDEHPRTTEFVAWAEKYIEMLSENLSPARLDERFAGKRLFGPDDDYNFYPSRW